MKKFLAIYMGSASSTKMEQWKTMGDAAQKKKEAVGMKDGRKFDMKNNPVGFGR